MKSILRALVRKTGFDIVRFSKPDDQPLDGIGDLTDVEQKVLEASREFTMTSPARMASLVHAMRYVIENDIPGDITECGVWRGGSMMIIAKMLIASGDTSRSLYLYDTYEGMSEPTEADTHGGESAAAQLDRAPKGTGIWCEASIEDVRANVLSTGYPEENIHFLKGKVEDTIPATLPGDLALLRLDTDWYESTKHELLHLYPLLSSKGILIIDDYGYWEGARKAVDEYFAKFPQAPFLHRIDNTGRLVVNPPPPPTS